MWQQIVVYSIVALALVLLTVKAVRSWQGKSACNCSGGCAGCPSCGAKGTKESQKCTKK